MFTTSCAYQLGSRAKSLPGNFKFIHVPYFKNKTLEPNIEIYFTNSMVQELEKSQFVKSVSLNDSEAILLGEITSLEFVATSLDKRGVPSDREITRQYQINLTSTYSLIRRSDQKKFWSTSITSSKTYIAPGVTASVLNTVNPLYNLSARRQNIEVIAQQQTSEVFERLSEDF
jgi:hypothetical protein